MNTTRLGAVDAEGLRDLYGQSETARAVLDHAAGRTRNWRKMSVERIVQILMHEGHAVSRRDIIEVFKRLEELGCGRFVAGRRGHRSRLEWSVGLVSVGRLASGEAEEIESIDEADAVEEGDVELIEHSYQLRPDLRVSLELPSDLSAGEADRLARHIQTLPFEQ